MKKFFLFVVCAFCALSSYASQEAPTVDVNLNSREVLYAKFQIDLGDFSDSFLESGENALNDLLQLGECMKALECSVTLTGKAGIFDTGVEVSVTVTGPSDEVMVKAKKLLKQLQEMIDDVR